MASARGGTASRRSGAGRSVGSRSKGGRTCNGRSRTGSACIGSGRRRIGSPCGGRGTGGTAALEISGVPACPFELETRRSQLFVEFWRAAGRAFGQGRVRHFLEHVLGMAAGIALVGINGHKAESWKKYSTLNCKSNPWWSQQAGNKLSADPVCGLAKSSVTAPKPSYTIARRSA